MERDDPVLTEASRPVTTRPGATEIDERLVRQLIGAQHPDLAELPLRFAASGWDNEMWRLGDDLVVRLPRTAQSASLTEAEMRWLPTLGQLPLPIPAFVRRGGPTAAFPWEWYVATWVAGTPANRVPITDGPTSAAHLATFLRALHRAAPADAPASRSLSDRARAFGEHLSAIRWRLDDPDGVEAVFAAALDAPPWDGPALWIHADLHPANVLVAAGVMCGIVDFGDLRSGDPAEDLGAAWALLPEDGITTFLDAYGDVSDDMLLRARGRAALTGVMLLSIGQAGERDLPGGQLTWLAPGEATIDRLLTR